MGASYSISTKFTAIDRFSAVTDKITSRLEKLRNKAETALQPLNRIAKIGVAATVTGAALAVRKFVTEASKIEDAVAGFTPLLGSADKAGKLINMMNIVAAKTPFEFEDISKTVGFILPFMNGNLEETISLFQRLGDTAGGKSQKLESITRGYSKALGKGKVDMESLNMIGEAGVPIIAELAKMYGVSTTKIYEMSSKGQIGIKDLNKVFQIMTSQGGIFFKGMEIASQTASGKISTLKDTINLTFAAIGEKMLPVIKEFTDRAIAAAEKIQKWAESNKELIQVKVREYAEGLMKVLSFLFNNFEKIIKVVKWAVIVFTSLWTITKLLTIAQAAATTATFAYNVVLGLSAMLAGKSAFAVHGNTVAYGAYRTAVLIAQAATWLFSAAVWSVLWPVLAVIAAVALLAAGVYFMIKKWDDWGAALTFVLGPLGWIVDLVMEFRDRWDNITQAFEQGGVLKGLKEIGKVLLSALIKPFEAFLRLLAKIPFLADKLQPAIDKLNNFREGMFTDPNKPILVNPDAANTEAQATVMNEWKGRLNVGVKADSGTTATVQQANGVTPTVSNTSTFKRN